MAKESIGGALIIGAMLLSMALLGSGYFVSQAIDRGAARLRGVTTELDGAALAGGREANRKGPSARPNSERRYEVELGNSPRKGGLNAPVTIVEWSDFQCPFCGRVLPTLAKLEKSYGDRVKFVFKHMPLPMHTAAPAAHAAAEAAHRQGKFWEMHDRIFAAQSKLSPDRFVGYAKAIGLDLERFERDVASADVKRQIDADIAQASKLGATGTPAFFINGRFLSGAQPYESFERVIDEELSKDS